MKETKVKEYYDNFSQNYDSFYEKIQMQKFKALNLSGIMNIDSLDLGGGTGLLSKYIDHPIITSDLSFRMLHIGREYIRNGITSDFRHLPFRKKSFRTICTITAIQNSGNYNDAMGEIKRILILGGKIWLTVLKKIVSIDDLRILMNSTGFQGEYFELPVEDVGFIGNSLKN